MKSVPRLDSITGVTAGLVLLAAGAAVPAYGAPPPNDSISSATEITAIPSEFVQDTDEATADPGDGRCVGGKSVWYRFRPDATRRVRMTTIGSDYDTVLAVFQGRRDDRNLVRCNDDAAGLASAVRARLEGGERYWIAVSSCCSRRSPLGGHAVLTLYRGGTTEVSVTVDSIESGGTSGRLLLTGTAVCGTPSFVQMEVLVSQRVGDAVARGWGFPTIDGCTDEPSEWEGAVDSETGWAFQPGMAVVDLTAFAEDGFAFATTDFDGTLEVTDNPSGRLRR